MKTEKTAEKRIAQKADAPKAVVSAPASPSPAKAAAKIDVPTPKPAAAPAAAIETKTAAVPAQADAALEGTSKTMNDTTTKFTSEATDRAQAMFGDINERAKTAMEKGAKLVEELNEFNKGNIEAVVESSKVAAKAAETIGQQAAEYGRKSFESASTAMKSFASVKSPTELFQLQSEYARSAFDSLIAETSKNSEAMLKLAGEVMQPISNRLAVAAEKIKTAA
jgi:phasin family protein